MDFACLFEERINGKHANYATDIMKNYADVVLSGRICGTLWHLVESVARRGI